MYTMVIHSENVLRGRRHTLNLPVLASNTFSTTDIGLLTDMYDLDVYHLLMVGDRAPFN